MALYHNKLFCRILSRLGIEWDVILFGVQSHIISQNKTGYFRMSKVAEVCTSTNTNSLVAESLKCSRNRDSGKTLLPCGNIFYVPVGHYVVRPSVRPPVCLSVCPPGLHFFRMGG